MRDVIFSKKNDQNKNVLLEFKNTQKKLVVGKGVTHKDI